MTKEMFVRYYDLFTSIIKQEVNETYCWNASCSFIAYCGGYSLELRPDCLLWGSELAFMQSLAERLCLSMEVALYDGLIKIY